MAEVLAVTPLPAPPDATVTVPGSKSVTNRALLVAALADGVTTLRGALLADDTWAMVGVVRALGAVVEVDEAAATIVVTGTGGRLAPGPVDLDARQSGTTARFVLPVLALGAGAYRLDAAAQLRARPMGPALDALAALGVEVAATAAPGRLPVVVTATGTVRGGAVDVPGDVSSQFLSGLLLAAPLLPEGLRVRVSGSAVSRSYLELTASTMTAFGASVSRPDERTWEVAPGGYRATDLDVEPDASAASYFFAAAAICRGRVRVRGLDRRTVQGDLAFVDVLAGMGASVERGDGWTEVRAAGDLSGTTVDLSDLSDTAQTLAVVAPFATGPVRVTGIGFIRAKETDRIGAVVTELRRCGVDAVEEADGFRIEPGTPHAARVRTYDDHRMAMSFALLGLRVPGIEIEDPGCVAKTYPGYFADLERLRSAGGGRGR